jgi:hypothetical protein
VNNTGFSFRVILKVWNIKINSSSKICFIFSFSSSTKEPEPFFTNPRAPGVSVLSSVKLSGLVTNKTGVVCSKYSKNSSTSVTLPSGIRSNYCG